MYFISRHPILDIEFFDKSNIIKEEFIDIANDRMLIESSVTLVFEIRRTYKFTYIELNLFINKSRQIEVKLLSDRLTSLSFYVNSEIKSIIFFSFNLFVKCN